MARYSLMLFLAGLFSASIALGSGGGGGGSGGSGSDDNGPISYDIGKKLFAEVVVCDSCPFSDLKQEPAEVRAAWKKIKRALRKKGEIGSELLWSERESVKRFIKKRFIKKNNSGAS